MRVQYMKFFPIRGDNAGSATLKLSSVGFLPTSHQLSAILELCRLRNFTQAEHTFLCAASIESFGGNEGR